MQGVMFFYSVYSFKINSWPQKIVINNRATNQSTFNFQSIRFAAHFNLVSNEKKGNRAKSYRAKRAMQS